MFSTSFRPGRIGILATLGVAATTISSPAHAADEITFTIGGFLNPQTSQPIPGVPQPPLIINGNEGQLVFTSPMSAGTLDPAGAYEIQFDLILQGGTGLFENGGELVLFEPMPLRVVLPLFGNFIDDAPERFFEPRFRNLGSDLPTPTFTREINFSGQEIIPFNFSFAFGGWVNEDGTFTFQITDIDLTSLGQSVGGLGIFQNIGDLGVPGQSNVSYPDIPELDLNIFFGLSPGDPGYDPSLNLRGVEIPSSRVTIRALETPEETGSGAGTEWRFESDLASTYGPAVANYLDDPKYFMTDSMDPDPFGAPFLQTQNGNPAAGNDAEVGVTERLSAFGTTSSFGIDPINGVEASVWRVAPTDRPATDLSDNARGIGLNVYPATAQFYGTSNFSSGRTMREYTLIYDIYIPQATWDRQFIAGLFNQDEDNDFSGYNPPNVLDGADLIIARDISGFGIFGPGVLMGTAPTNINGKLDSPDAPGFEPETWMRVAFVNDDSFEKASRIYINGVPAVDIAYSGAIQNRVDPLDPEWTDFPTIPGTPSIDPATWAAWGNTPNPWVDTDNDYELFSTFSLFSEPGGRAGEYYVANVHFAERLFSPAELAELGGPDANGIVRANEADGLPGFDFLDVLSFLGQFEAGRASAEHDGVPGLDGGDITSFLNSGD